MIDAGAQLVDVLPEGEYREGHLPSAINIPLEQLDARTTQALDRRPIVVYCWDSLCDLSPRAACRLETLRFSEVYDHTHGEVDWLAHGLDTEGETDEALTVGRLALDDVVACRLDDRVGDVRERVDASPYGFGVVTGAGLVLLVLLGRLRPRTLDGDPAASAEDGDGGWSLDRASRHTSR